MGWFHDIDFQLILGSAFVQRSLAMKKLIYQDPKRPYISFRSVVIVDQSLWTHVYRTSHRDVSKELFGPDSKAKVSNFEISFLDEDIGQFQISVNNKIFA